MSRSPSRSRVFLAVLAITMLVMSISALALLSVDWTQQAHPLDLYAGILATVGLIAALVGWVKGRTPTSETPLVPDVKAAAETLVALVKDQWHDEARHRGTEGPHPMPVRWQFTASKALMGPRHLIAPEGFVFDGRSDQIKALADQFRALKRQRLIISGGPGTGKTTLAVHLLQHLLSVWAADQAAASPSEIVPVPVLLPVSRWNTDTHPRLQLWLAEQLEQDYPALKAPQFGPGAAAALARGGHVLPVLDGLDEVGHDQRARVMAALNASLGERQQFILTSRKEELERAQAGQPVSRTAVIAPSALTSIQAASYLRARLSDPPPHAWGKVLDALTGGTAPGLAAVAAVPLGLWLIRTVYLDARADPSPLAGPLGTDDAALRAHLLDQIIPAVINNEMAGRSRSRRRWDAETTRRYLDYLARIFPPAEGRDISWWRIAAATPHMRRDLRLIVGLVVTLLASLSVIFTLALTVVPEIAVGFGIASLSLGFIAWRESRTWPDNVPAYADFRLHGRVISLLNSIAQRMSYGFMAGLSVMVGVQFLPGPGRELRVALAIGLSVALAVALGAGLTAWAESPSLMSISTPGSSYRSDKARTLARALAVGLPLGLAIGFAVGIGLGFGTAAGIVCGLATGFTVWLTAGWHHAWLACIIATGKLALAGQLPWQLMKFLDDAHRLELLRAVGPIYQFRHAALHDHLAAKPSQRSD
ncbi:NACHT domain-containing protein [Nonomuraea sp. NPDC049269]|uniref:NACHT domain-containing protein n=1 Tax=Nonomuraea sp. NPDC049269 TaxID=3364349 RepID=UPI00371E639C